MQFAGMWKNENVDMVFSKIRKDWDKWQKELCFVGSIVPD